MATLKSQQAVITQAIRRGATRAVCFCGWKGQEHDWLTSIAEEEGKAHFAKEHPGEVFREHGKTFLIPV